MYFEPKVLNWISRLTMKFLVKFQSMFIKTGFTFKNGYDGEKIVLEKNDQSRFEQIRT